MKTNRFIRTLTAIMTCAALTASLVACAGSGNTPGPSQASTAEDSGASSDQAAQSDETFHFVFASHMPSTAVGNKTFQIAMDEITARTDGRVTFDLFTDGTLVESSGIIDGLDSGICDLAIVNYNHQNGRLNLAGVTSLPGISDNTWEGTMALLEVAAQDGILQEQFENNNLHILGFFMGKGNIIFSTKEVNDLSDLSGRKVISTTDTISQLVQNMGGTVLSFSNTESYEALSKNTADTTASCSYDSLTANGLEEVAKYAFDINLGSGPQIVCMNTDKWNALPADLQQIFTEVFGEYLAETVYRKYVLEEDKDKTSREIFEEAGGQVVTASGEQIDGLADYSEEIWQKWISDRNAEGTDGQAMVDAYQQAYANYKGTCPF